MQALFLQFGRYHCVVRLLLQGLPTASSVQRDNPHIVGQWFGVVRLCFVRCHAIVCFLFLGCHIVAHLESVGHYFVVHLQFMGGCGVIGPLVVFAM